MKKLVITTLTLLTCGAAYALPIGNPSEASLFRNGLWCESINCCDPCDPCFRWCDAWSFRIGFYGDYVFNRHLEVDDSQVSAGKDRDINTTEINTNAGYLAVNLCDRIDVFATLGMTHMYILTDSKALGFLNTSNGNGVETTIEFGTDFSWSVGARATVFECGCFGVGIEGQYFRAISDIDYVLFKDTGGEFFYLNNDNSVCYSEWQVGLGASYRIATRCPTVAIVPYAGVKWSGARLNTDTPLIRSSATENIVIPDLESKKCWGWAVGTSFTLCDMVGVTVEGRFADEKAVYVNGQFRF